MLYIVIYIVNLYYNIILLYYNIKLLYIILYNINVQCCKKR